MLRAVGSKPPHRRSALPHLQARPELDRLFDALADVDRLLLLGHMDQPSFTAGLLAPKLGWTRDATSKQLHLLERAGLARSGRFGRGVEYFRTAQGLAAARNWLADLWTAVDLRPLSEASVLSPEKQVAVAGALRTAGRRHMLECMCLGGPITQGAAAEDCGLSQGLASRGLNHLISAGLVTIQTSGPPRRYVASPAELRAAMAWFHGEAHVAAEAEVVRRRLEQARAARAVKKRR